MNKKLYLATMRWPENNEPICIGRNKEKVKRAALLILKDEYGEGNVDRLAAFCSMPITGNDIEFFELPLIE
jgi:hypothetical protein